MSILPGGRYDLGLTRDELRARAIVKALADGGPYTDREYGDCTLCGADYSFPSMGMVHESNCPYWMAVDFMAAKGEK